MFTLYSMAAQGEGNAAALTQDSYMGPYWAGAKLLFQRLAAFGKPAVVHLEPDWWGFAMQKSPDGTAAVHVTTLAPDCSGSSNDLIGMATCLRTLARQYAPKVKIGFHVSQWGGTPSAIISFFKAIGADQGDFIATDMLDRDAGCYEAHTDPNCQRGGGPWYFDETNTASPNFHEHLAWVTQMTQGIGLPMMWWQVPFGVPSTTMREERPGTTATKSRALHVLTRISEFVAAGGVDSVWGTGSGNQTTITTDGAQFKNTARQCLLREPLRPLSRDMSHAERKARSQRPFRVLGLQQIAVGATDKGSRLRHLLDRHPGPRSDGNVSK